MGAETASRNVQAPNVRVGTRGGRPAGRPARAPLRGLTVLYDPHCRLCAFVAGWLRGQRQLVPIRLVPVGSAQARSWFPALDHDGATRREITVVGDAGQVYTGDAAWLVCLWALAAHRAFSHTLATPAGRRLARAAVLSAARWRDAQTRKDGWAQWREPAAGSPLRHPVAPRPGGGGTQPAGAAPVWVYEGKGGWTQRLPTPAPVAAPMAAPEAGGGGCADGCPPPG